MAGDDRRDRPTDEAFDDLSGLAEDDFVQALLRPLDRDAPDVPDGLPDQTIRKVQAQLTGRDLIDLTTFVFLMRFCAPLLDLLAAFFGHDPLSPPESMSTPRRSRGGPTSDPLDRNDPDE